MIDEYQDTNHAQYRFASLLAAKYKNLCVVGDEDQSVYAFRGATIRNILEFERDYPDAQVFKLEQNYRSTQTILDAANALIRNNTQRKDKRLFTDEARGTKVVMRYQADDEHDEAHFVAGEINRAHARSRRRRGSERYRGLLPDERAVPRARRDRSSGTGSRTASSAA